MDLCAGRRSLLGWCPTREIEMIMAACVVAHRIMAMGVVCSFVVAVLPDSRGATHLVGSGIMYETSRFMLELGMRSCDSGVPSFL